jgi:hypothetical protein
MSRQGRPRLADRIRARGAARRGIAPQPVQEEEAEDASELEYQEKTTRKKRSNTRRKKDDN